MSEAAASAGFEASGQPTAGQLLRHAREAAGLHVAQLAVSLKVPVRKLEALEEDRYEELPDAVFARGLAASVCRTLKIDPQPILERLPEGKARLRADEGINAPFRAPSDGPPPSVLEQLTRPVGLAVIALLLAALVLIFLPTVRLDGIGASSGTQPVAQPAAPAPAASEPAPMVTEPAAIVPQPPAVASATSPAVPAASAALPASATAPAAVPAAPAATPAASAPAARASAPVAGAGALPAAALTPAALTPAAGELVAFRARAPSWVQVTDAKGAVVMQRLLNAGESATAGGTPPLTVTVGSVEATEVQVRGKPFDMRGLARDNVARFQVK